MSLAGDWAVQLDPKNVGEDAKWPEKTLAGRISMPGSTGEAQMGEKVERLDVNRWAARIPIPARPVIEGENRDAQEK